MDLKRAAEELRKGRFVIIYDGDEREGEADLVLHAQNIRPERIETLRKEAGGLICLAVSGNIAEKLGLPFISDVIEKEKKLAPLVINKTAYGDKPAFSLAINHRGVYTGITDNDRSLTIKKFAELVERKGGPKDLAKEFYTPGHVFLLIGRGIENRRGHTELSLELAKQAGLDGTMVLCEMLGIGKALAKKDVIEYAERNGLAFIEGKELAGEV